MTTEPLSAERLAEIEALARPSPPSDLADIMERSAQRAAAIRDLLDELRRRDEPDHCEYWDATYHRENRYGLVDCHIGPSKWVAVAVHDKDGDPVDLRWFDSYEEAATFARSQLEPTA